MGGNKRDWWSVLVFLLGDGGGVVGFCCGMGLGGYMGMCLFGMGVGYCDVLSVMVDVKEFMLDELWWGVIG